MKLLITFNKHFVFYWFRYSNAVSEYILFLCFYMSSNVFTQVCQSQYTVDSRFSILNTAVTYTKF